MLVGRFISRVYLLLHRSCRFIWMFRRRFDLFADERVVLLSIDVYSTLLRDCSVVVRVIKCCERNLRSGMSDVRAH